MRGETQLDGEFRKRRYRERKRERERMAEKIKR